MDQLTALPKSFAAGTTVKYTRSCYTSFPSPTWTLKLHLNGASKRDFTATTNADGKSFDLLLGAESGTGTSDLAPGTYSWQERVSHANGEKYVLASGTVVITANLETAAAGIGQTPEERELAQVDALIAKRLNEDMSSYTFEQRAAQREDLEKLYKRRDALRAKIKAQQHKGRFSTPVRMSFSRPR